MIRFTLGMMVSLQILAAAALASDVRITMSQVRQLEAAGHRVHYVDTRGKIDTPGIPGAAQVSKEKANVPANWSKDALIVAYCT